MIRNNISIIGLDRAGKTVIRNYLISGKMDTEVRPTLAFDISKFTDEDLYYSLVDFPGQIKFRKLWPQQFAYTKILIFVLDVSDAERFEEADKEFTQLLDNELLDNVPVLFLFHKTDKPEGKDNLTKAKEYFDLKAIRYHSIFSFDTSVKVPAALDKVKQTMITILRSLVLE